MMGELMSRAASRQALTIDDEVTFYDVSFEISVRGGQDKPGPGKFPKPKLPGQSFGTCLLTMAYQEKSVDVSMMILVGYTVCDWFAGIAKRRIVRCLDVGGSGSVVGFAETYGDGKLSRSAIKSLCGERRHAGRTKSSRLGMK